MAILNTTPLVALAVAVALAGCASSTGSSTLTLAETKSPVQLLRNDAIDRVESRFVAEVRPSTDHSVACLDEGANPGGLIRQWRSSVEIVLAKDADLDYVSERLIQGFTGKGWDAEKVSDTAPFELTTLTSDNSPATVEISSDQHVDGAVIKVVTIGPCVKTAGPDSDEVKRLES